MALVLPPRVLATSTTTGTGTYTLGSAVTGWQSFAAVGDANTCYYVAWAVDADGVPTGDWEEGLGTYASSGTTLARTAVYASSNSGSAVSWSAGTKHVAVTRPSVGTLVVRQPGGTAGTDEIRVEHDGSAGYIRIADGYLYITKGDGTQLVHFDPFGGMNVGGAITIGSGTRTYGGYTGGPGWASGITFPSPAGVVSVDNASAGGTLRSIPLSPSEITADTNNYAPGVARFYRLSTDASRTLTGLSVSQVDGQECEVWNVGSNALVLAHQSASSTAANRFICTGAADITLAADEVALLRYDGTTARWRVRKV